MGFDCLQNCCSRLPGMEFLTQHFNKQSVLTVENTEYFEPLTEEALAKMDAQHPTFQPMQAPIRQNSQISESHLSTRSPSIPIEYSKADIEHLKKEQEKLQVVVDDLEKRLNNFENFYRGNPTGQNQREGEPSNSIRRQGNSLRHSFYSLP